MVPFEKRIPPVWDDIKAVWDECLGFFGAQGLNGDVAYALSMTAQELLENAVKYGAYRGGSDQILLTLETARSDVIIEVKHPIGADPATLRHFDESIQWIRGFQSPFEAYVEKLKRVSAQPYLPGHSGLGLARIAYEGQCILDFYVNEHDILSVSAVYRR